MRNEMTGEPVVGTSIGLTIILLVVFGITFVAVASFYLLSVLATRFRGEPGLTIREKARAAFEAADLGWLALFCGPLCGFVITLFTVPKLLFDHNIKLSDVPKWLVSVTVVGLVAGVILAGAFWASASLLGKVRKTAKLARGKYDPDFDGPI
jgi:hypothetical protein